MSRKSLHSEDVNFTTIEKNVAQKDYYTEARSQIIRANDIAETAVKGAKIANIISWFAAGAALISALISLTNWLCMVYPNNHNFCYLIKNNFQIIKRL